MSTTYATSYAETAPTTLQADLDKTSSSALYELGTKICLADGREYMYCKAGASDLVAGKLVQAPAPVADHKNKTVGANASVGDVSITINVVTTDISENEYANGFIHINDAAGEGYIYKIKSHPAASAGSTCVIQIYGTVQSALTSGTSEYTLTKHPCNGVIVAPTTLTSVVLGVPNIAVSASKYFWLQTKGPAAVLTDGTVVIGAPVKPSGTVAGAVSPTSAATDVQVGKTLQVNADTEYSLINLDV